MKGTVSVDLGRVLELGTRGSPVLHPMQMDTRSHVLPLLNENSWYLGVMCTSESSFEFPLLLQTIDM